jgi:hypothetical protein
MHSGSAHQDPDDPRLAKLAARQHGVVAWRQLLALGYSKQAIHTLIANGWLHRVHRGVYAVGHTRISLRAHWMAAVLACGPPKPSHSSSASDRYLHQQCAEQREQGPRADREQQRISAEAVVPEHDAMGSGLDGRRDQCGRDHLCGL